MRCGFNTLAAQAEKFLELDPYSGHLFVFRGRRGDLLKIIWWDSQGACLFSKRLERGCFVWPAAKDGKVSVTAAQLSTLLEGIDWRMLCQELIQSWPRYRFVENNSAVHCDAANLKAALGKINRQYANL